MNALFNGLHQPAWQKFQHPVFNQNPSLTHKNEALLDNVLTKALSKIAPVDSLNTADFSPQAVANRVIDFVTNAISQRAKTDSEAEAMLQEARDGVAQGFAEANDILKSLGEFSDEINAQINETKSLINQGLDALAQPVSDAAEISTLGKSISAAGYIYSEFKQASEASIEIKTQDGDKVEISYSAFIGSTTNKEYYTDERISSGSFESYNESSVAYQFKIQGELDEGEQQAINALLNEVGDIANRFFSGDVQAAFNSALELGFDSEELKSFSLDFQQQTDIRMVEAYRYTEQLVDAEDIPADPRPAVNVLSQIEQLLEQLKEKTQIEQPENMLKALLADMLDGQLESPIQSYIQDVIASY